MIGVWSERWLRRPIFEETPDTGLLMWWMRGTVKTDANPDAIVYDPVSKRVFTFNGRGKNTTGINAADGTVAEIRCKVRHVGRSINTRSPARTIRSRTACAAWSRGEDRSWTVLRRTSG